MERRTFVGEFVAGTVASVQSIARAQQTASIRRIGVLAAGSLPHWQATRFSDASRYGVWYGSIALETTVYETAWHWYRFVRDSFADEDRDIVTERRAFEVRCDALLIDLRGKEAGYPDLASRTSYALTQQVGAFVHEQDLNGLLVHSARCDGTNAAVFKPERLSDVRHLTYLTYHLNAPRDTFVAERAPGRKWLRVAPSTLG